MSEWLVENWWALWLTLFLLFAVVEMITLDLFFIMLGGGALAGLVADFAGADPWLQIIAFCVVSLLMIGFVRPVALKHLHRGPADQRTNIERLIGESAERLKIMWIRFAAAEPERGRDVKRKQMAAMRLATLQRPAIAFQHLKDFQVLRNAIAMRRVEQENITAGSETSITEQVSRVSQRE